MYSKESLKKMVDEIEKLLSKHANSDVARYSLAPKIAEASVELNHLYEDLGFKSRTQMNKFMRENFPSLAELKPNDIRWKKFLYDSVGMVAPACESCKDMDNCFKCELKAVAV